MTGLAPRATLLALAAMTAACGASSHSGRHSTTAATAPTARGDAFHGTITAATGLLSGRRGDVTVVLAHPPRVANASTPVTLAIVGAGLRGRLRGRMIPQHSLPDVGHRFEIGARGTVAPLGPVQASGTAAGTGFIRFGHTALVLTLRSARGAVTVVGRSSPVPGRTDP